MPRPRVADADRPDVRTVRISDRQAVATGAADPEVRDLGPIGRPERVPLSVDHPREVRAVGGEGVDPAVARSPHRDAVARR